MAPACQAKIGPLQSTEQCAQPLLARQKTFVLGIGEQDLMREETADTMQIDHLEKPTGVCSITLASLWICAERLVMNIIKIISLHARTAKPDP